MLRALGVFVSSVLVVTPVGAQSAVDQQVEGVELVELRSELLSAFWGRDITMRAGVVLPPDDQKGTAPWPVCYSIHGFGGDHRSAWRTGPRLRAAMTEKGYPAMVYVFLDASCPLGHHEFADSVNNGPWGQALITEFIPHLEARYDVAGRPEGRFLTGHSSGGWSSLWLQVTYPEFFGGTWSTAPDAMDFRDFTGVNVYEDANAYFDADGVERPLMRRNGEWALTLKGFVDRFESQVEYGGQMGSFDAVFSPRGDDGRPMPVFDRKTGAIDPAVAKAWARYDISLIVRRNWAELGPKLAGKIRVFCGLQDTFRLEGACKLFEQELAKLGSDAEIVLVEGRDHGSVMAPHELWPEGLMARVHREMLATYRGERTATQEPADPQDAHDALRYEIEVEVDLAAERVTGNVIYSFRADRALQQVVLDAEHGDDWTVEFSDAQSRPLEVAWSDQRAVIALREPVAAGEQFTLFARLDGNPIDGFYFAKNRYGEAMAFTDHYSIRARGWLPCEDHPGDRASFRVLASYPAELTAVASGVPSDAGPVLDPKPGMRILHHETKSDIPPYMFALAFGPWVEVEEQGDEQLRPHLVYARDVATAKLALTHHAAWIATMEQTFGDYPYGKYMVFQCPTRWGGFEAPGNVQISEGLLDGPGGVGVLAHELVHMWFGDGVGYAKWREVWLSEGFASYFGPWLWASTGGPSLVESMAAARSRWQGSADGRTKSVRWDGFAHPDVALNTNTYQKGAWVLHMLRGELGDEAFFAAIGAYYREHVGRSVTTTDFVASVERSSGRDLGWFFAQWLERVGCPELRWQLVDGVLAIEQAQPGAPYRLRVPVAWRDETGRDCRRIVECSEPSTRIELGEVAAGSLQIDPDTELLWRPAR